MYNGSIINESATLMFNVKNNLTGGAFTAVKFSDTDIKNNFFNTEIILIEFFQYNNYNRKKLKNLRKVAL